MNKQVAMPEFITRNDIQPRAWSVQEGAPARGDAWTEMRTATMRVPFGDDAMSRVIRAHELTHAKISPIDASTMNDWITSEGLTRESVIAAEEFRVNMTIKHLGFDVDALRDGSEVKSGEICGSNNNWNGAVRFVAGTAGTKACSDFIRGIKKTNPVISLRARELEKQLLKYHKQIVSGFSRGKRDGYQSICDTRKDYETGMPEGFLNHTKRIARMLDRLIVDENSGSGEPGPFGEVDEPGDIPSPSDVFGNRAGKFAQVIEKVLPKPRHVDGRLGRKRIAANVGKNPRRMDRMLVDPERRIFDRRAKGKGGVVLIDQSGSMSLSEDEIWEIISHAPGCVIIGYSHRAGSIDTPNVWVIADRGKVVDEIPEGNGGNGVDGPAIRFAQARRRHNEPFIWVCDGQVTDGMNDNSYDNLEVECVKLVAKHGIHMVGSVSKAVEVFKDIANGKRPGVSFTGPLRFRAQTLNII